MAMRIQFQLATEIHNKWGKSTKTSKYRTKVNFWVCKMLLELHYH